MMGTLFPLLKACRILLKGDGSERNELIEAEGSGGDSSLCNKYLGQAVSVFACDCMEGITMLVKLPR